MRQRAKRSAAAPPRAGRRRPGGAAAAGATAPALRRATQRESLLDEAAAQFNLRGISGTSVNDVARRIGLTRAALYYYVDDREDLVFQSYMRACELTADDLRKADDEGRDAIAKVAAYVRRTLSPDRPPSAVITELAYLSQPMRAVVEKADRRNVAHLEQLLTDGVAKGGIRDCDTRIAAQTIMGVLNWVRVSPTWLGNEPGFAARTADALVDAFERGIAARADAAVPVTIDVATFAESPRNFFDRESAAALKSEQLLATASRMFNQRGFDGVSLDDIAAALGATKGALYYYFTDKRDLILRCYERACALDEKFADVSEQSGASGLERAMIGLHLNVQAQIGGPWPLVPLIGVESIAPRSRKDLVRRMEKLWQRFTAFGHEGIRDGSIRNYDVEAVALAGAGVFGWIPKWLRDDEAGRKWEIADEMVRFFLHGLRRK